MLLSGKKECDTLISDEEILFPAMTMFGVQNNLDGIPIDDR